MKEYGLQLWSIRDHFTDEQNTREAFLTMQKYGYTTAQTAGSYDYIAPELFRQYADEAGVRIVGTHYSKDRIISDVAGTIKYHRTLGTDTIGVGGAWGKIYEDPEEFRSFVREFNRLGAIYAAEGFKFTYHNHVREFEKFDETHTYFDVMVEEFNPDTVQFCVDSMWAQAGGVDVCALLRRLAGRVEVLHLKDAAPVRFKDADGHNRSCLKCIEIGRGNLNFKDIIATAEETGVKKFIVEDESESPEGSYHSIAITADYIQKNLLK